MYSHWRDFLLKKSVTVSALLFVLFANFAYAAPLDNFKYGEGNKSILSAENGTWSIGNSGNPIDINYSNTHLGGIVNSWLPAGDSTYIYFSPTHGDLTACKAYDPKGGCYASYEFIITHKSDLSSGYYFKDWKYSSATEQFEFNHKYSIAPYDGTSTPPSVNNGVDLSKTTIKLSGKVYLGEKSDSNLLKNTNSLVNISPSDGINGLPVDTLADGSYTISQIFRTSTNGVYSTDIYTVFVKKRVDNSVLDALSLVGCLDILPLCGSNVVDNFKKVNDEVWLVGQTTVTISPDGTISSQDIIVKEVTVSALDKALSSAITTFGGWVQTTLKWSMNWIQSLLTKTEDYVIGGVNCKTDGSVCGMEGPWTTIRNISLVFLVMALIIIAFANALQIDIEQYGLNRMIPKIIISIFFAYSSWLIFVFFFDFTTMLQNQAVGLISTNGVNASTQGLTAVGNLNLGPVTAGSVASEIGSILLLLLLCVVVLACGLVLLFFLIIRIVVLCFLLTVAPLAFILNIAPFASSLYKQWWSWFWKWMFMGPFSMIIIALGWVIATSVGGDKLTNPSLDTSMISTSPVTTGPSGNGELLIGLIIFAVALIMAVQLPLKMGGGIMKSWSKAGKGLGKWAGKTTGVSGAAGIVKNHFKAQNLNREALWANAIARTGSRGHFGTSTEVIKRQQFDAAVTEAGKQIGVTTAGEASLISRYKRSHNTYERAAIERQMASNGNLEKLYANIGTSAGSIDAVTGAWVQPITKKEQDPVRYKIEKDALDDAQRTARLEAGKAIVQKMGSDQVLEKAVKDNQAELFVAARNTYVANKDESDIARYAVSQYEGVLAGQKNKALKDKRMNLLDELEPKEAGRLISAEEAATLNNPQVSTEKARSKVKSFRERMQEEGKFDQIPDYLKSDIAAPQQVNNTNQPTPPGVNPNSYEQSPSGLWTPKDKQ